MRVLIGAARHVTLLNQPVPDLAVLIFFVSTTENWSPSLLADPTPPLNLGVR